MKEQKITALYRFTRPPGGLWRHGDFLNLWGAQLISALGSRITRTALPILAVLTIHASAEQVAMLTALSMAPGVLVGLLLGGRIDRRAERPVLIAAHPIPARLPFTLPPPARLGRPGLGPLHPPA